MLRPDEVVPFLLHKEEIVRDHALHYLTHAHDPSPATAEDLWRMIDRFGMQASLSVVSGLDELPQTEVSLGRTMDALRRGADELSDFHLQIVLEKLDWPLLERHAEELLNFEKLVEPVRDHLRKRLEMRPMPAVELWEQLMAHGTELGDSCIGEFDDRVSRRLVEAIAHDPGDVPAWAVALLKDNTADDWRSIFAVAVVEATRYEPALDVLFDLFLIDADYLWERVVDALTAIGSVEVIHRIERFVPGKSWDVRLFCDDPLERIKRPESELAVEKLLEQEPSPDIRGFLAGSLCELIAEPSRLARVRDLWAAGRLEEQDVDVPEMLLAAGTMVGYEPPEAKRWWQQVRERNRRHTKEHLMLSVKEMGKEWRERWRQGLPREDRAKRERDNGTGGLLPGTGAEAVWPQESAAPRENQRWDEALTPIRRDEPKVGRNEPCPCGSGKKHKKCCGK
jgi:hypothetical protein